MKKLFLLALACTVLPVQAFASVKADLTGEVQVIASDVRDNSRSQFNSGTNFRVLAGMTAELTDDVKANLLFQYVNAWGNSGAANANFGTSGATLQEYWDNVTLAEANIVLSNLFGALEATVGRQFYGDESSAVMYFGPTHYISESMTATSVDGAKLSWNNDNLTLTAIAGRAAYTAPLYGNGISEEKTSFYGAEIVAQPSDALRAQAYVYDLRNLQVMTSKGVREFGNAGLYGAKLTYAPSALTLAAEYARNFQGQRVFKEESVPAGYMFKGDVSVAVETDFASLTPRGSFIYSADQFRAHGNYSAGIFIGDNFGDIFTYFGNQGIWMFNVGLDIRPQAWPKWSFSIDGYALQDRSGQTAATYEGDLVIKYAHNDYVELFAGAAYLKNGTLNRQGVNGNDGKGYGKDNAKGQLGMLVRF